MSLCAQLFQVFWVKMSQKNNTRKLYQAFMCSIVLSILGQNVLKKKQTKKLYQVFMC